MKVMVLIYLALFFIMASSCQKNNSNAAVSSSCITNPSACDSSLNQQSTGFSNYNNSSNPFSYYNNTAYLCNCPMGTIPSYNGTSGLACVQTSYNSSSYFSFYAYIGWSNNQWYNMPQLNSYNYNPYSSSSCYNGAVQSCVLGAANTCPVGTNCLQNSGGSSLGLCVTAYR